MLPMNNKPVSIHQAATIIGSLGGRPSKRTHRGGFISSIPDNTLYLNNEPLTLNGVYLTLGPSDMSIDVANPGTDGQALASAMAALFGGFVDYTSTPKRLGLGIPDASMLRAGPLTVGSAEGGAGDEIFTNPDFDGNANGWTLSNLQYTDHAVSVIDTGSNGLLSQTIDTQPGGFVYRCSITVSDVTNDPSNVVVFGFAGNSDNIGGIVADGTYFVDITAPESFTEVEIDIHGSYSVNEVHFQRLSDKVAMSLLHNDGSLGIENVMSASNLGEPSFIRVVNDSYLIQPGNYFGLLENPVDQGHTLTLNHYNLTDDRVQNFQDQDGDIDLSSAYNVADLPTPTSNSARAFAMDSSDPLDSASLGTEPTGGGSNWVPVYWDPQTQVWRIG